MLRWCGEVHWGLESADKHVTKLGKGWMIVSAKELRKYICVEET